MVSLHVVSNGIMSLKEFAQLAKTVDPYIDTFHIREKQKSAKELFEGVQWILDAGIAPDKLVINDRVDVALALGVGGVQLAYHSLSVKVVREQFPSLLIGCSTHSVKEVFDAELGGANFAVFGHVFTTSSKKGLEPRGCMLLREICSNSNVPIIAIGGITPENTRAVFNHGAKGIAVMSGILNHQDPLSAAKQYRLAITNWKEEQHEEAL
jgi:thiazole tautomerase (transcriptional regulator TenI)